MTADRIQIKPRVWKRIAEKRASRRLRSVRKRAIRRYHASLLKQRSANLLGKKKATYESVSEVWLPPNLMYLLSCEQSGFYFDRVTQNIPNNKGYFYVPRNFSIVETPEVSYRFIENILGALLTQKYPVITIDYSLCINLDLSAQVLLDVILKDVILFFKRLSRFPHLSPKVKEINGRGLSNPFVRKLLFSVGSPVILQKRIYNQSDIVPYRLCIHNRDLSGNPVRIQEQKDIDTTKLVEYVIECLSRLNYTLTDDKIEDLSIVIGEILINAEEHSTTRHRFSIGYFHEHKQNGNHFGVFRLSIFNFGDSIYQKFKDPDCPNKAIVKQMRRMSKKYRKRSLFQINKFDEEALWTLYALQEGVTSVAPTRYRQRGNGSIQFINSFFNIKGRLNEKDDFSKMAILSGRAKILFDGSYSPTETLRYGKPYKLMTFNNSGRLADPPNSKFVYSDDNYFPGTIITAKILFNEDDLSLGE